MPQLDLTDYLAAVREFYVTEGVSPRFLYPDQVDASLAGLADKALDAKYHYGRSKPGNSFGWQALLGSVSAGKMAIYNGETDLEAIADHVHQGWSAVAKKFVENPDQFDDTSALREKGTLDAKRKSRNALLSASYAQLPEDEKEKDRVIARVLQQEVIVPPPSSSTPPWML